MKARLPILAIALLFLASSLGALASPAAAQELSGTIGGNLRIAAASGIDFNPLTMTAMDMRYESLVWDTLARPNPISGEPEPWAAVGWEPNRTAGTITVTIRVDLRWSDGAAITSADVAATFGAAHYGFATSAPDASTVVFTFGATGAGRFYTEVLYGYIAWNAAGAKKYSGLFAPDSETASPLVLNANDNHWTGGPNLRTVTVSWPNTLEEAACDLLNEQVDLIGFPVAQPDLSTQWPSCGNLTLVNPDPALTKPFAAASLTNGPAFLYYGFNAAGGSANAAPELRDAIHRMMNKGTARAFEPGTVETSSVISERNLFWHMPEWNEMIDAGFAAQQLPADIPRAVTNLADGLARLDEAGYIDRDADGWREDPTGAPLLLEFLVVDLQVDPRKFSIVNDFIEVNLRSRAGINAVLVPQPSWADLWSNVSSGNYDAYLAVATDARQNPRFLESFTPMLDANDPDVNLHLILGQNSYTLAERRLHFNHVTFYNSICACVAPVLSYKTVEAYNRDSFTGWVDAFDGVFNVWSIQELRLPPQGGLHVDVATFAAGLNAGGTTTVQVTVSDDAGSAVPDANVALSASGGTLSATSGTTDASGRFSGTYTAPAVGGVTEVALTATAWKEGYTGTSESATVTVHPVARSLVVSVTVTPNNLDAGTQASVTVLVEDAVTRSDVSGATVTLSTSLPGGTLGATSGTTDASGVFSTTFSAKPKVGSIYRIDATASAPGYTGAESAGSAIVAQDFGTYEERTRVEIVPGFETLFVVAALGAALALMRFRRGRREG